jgi:hypothetical protein
VIDTATYVAEACRLHILLVLFAAVAGKLTAMSDFRDTIPLPFPGVHAVAVGVAGAEATAAVLLAAGASWARAGMAAALILFILFTGAILFALVQGRTVQCRCFGGRGHAISIHDVARNLMLMAACGVYLRYGAPGVPIDAAGWMLLSGIAVILLLITLNFDEIAMLARPA